MHPTHLPIRVATGSLILSSGLDKLGADEETANGIHGKASAAYPFLKDVKPKDFAEALAYGEIALGAALLTPMVPSAVAGTALAGFGAGLVGVYWNAPGLRREGDIRPTQEGMAAAKDVVYAGVGLTLATQGTIYAAKDAAKSARKSAQKAAKDARKQAKSGAKSARKNTPGSSSKLESTLRSAQKNAQKNAKAGLQDARSGAKNAQKSAKSGLKDAKSSAQKSTSSGGKGPQSAKKNVRAGLKDTRKNMKSAYQDARKQAGKDAKKARKAGKKRNLSLAS